MIWRSLLIVATPYKSDVVVGCTHSPSQLKVCWWNKLFMYFGSEHTNETMCVLHIHARQSRCMCTKSVMSLSDIVVALHVRLLVHYTLCCISRIAHKSETKSLAAHDPLGNSREALPLRGGGSAECPQKHKRRVRRGSREQKNTEHTNQSE